MLASYKKKPLKKTWFFEKAFVPLGRWKKSTKTKQNQWCR